MSYLAEGEVKGLNNEYNLWRGEKKGFIIACCRRLGQEDASHKERPRAGLLLRKRPIYLPSSGVIGILPALAPRSPHLKEA